VPPTIRIEPARASDVPLIITLIGELAEYEHLAPQMTATEDVLRASLFGARPAAEVLLAYANDQPAGMAIFFQNFSSFLGVAGLYLEDLFVRPAWRRHGVGRKLLKELARIAVSRGCGRVEWAVLDWNEPAIKFYKALGARAMDEWTVFRVTGDSLQRLAR
jgi:GNAT superfamily N-acetyltransferase